MKAKLMRKAVCQQLRYLTRNFKHIEKLQDLSANNPLNGCQEQELEVIHTLYDQQKKMYEHKTHSVENRFVSISRPHVRSIVRGKIKTPTEFGAKFIISLIVGEAFIEQFCLSVSDNEPGTIAKVSSCLFCK